MQPPAPAMRTIEIDEQVHDVLARTAATRDTDINGALHYVLEAPASPAASSDEDDD